jgi:hypothetical protein
MNLSFESSSRLLLDLVRFVSFTSYFMLCKNPFGVAIWIGKNALTLQPRVRSSLQIRFKSLYEWWWQVKMCYRWCGFGLCCYTCLWITCGNDFCLLDFCVHEHSWSVHNFVKKTWGFNLVNQEREWFLVFGGCRCDWVCQSLKFCAAPLPPMIGVYI